VVRLRAISPLAATVILIAITLAAALLVYAIYNSFFSAQTKILRVEFTSASLIYVTDTVAYVKFSVKNVGTLIVTNCTVKVFGGGGQMVSFNLGFIDVGETKEVSKAVNLSLIPGNEYLMSVEACHDSQKYMNTISVKCSGG